MRLTLFESLRIAIYATVRVDGRPTYSIFRQTRVPAQELAKRNRLSPALRLATGSCAVSVQREPRAEAHALPSRPSPFPETLESQAPSAIVYPFASNALAHFARSSGLSSIKYAHIHTIFTSIIIYLRTPFINTMSRVRSYVCALFCLSTCPSLSPISPKHSENDYAAQRRVVSSNQRCKEKKKRA